MLDFFSFETFRKLYESSKKYLLRPKYKSVSLTQSKVARIFKAKPQIIIQTIEYSGNLKSNSNLKLIEKENRLLAYTNSLSRELGKDVLIDEKFLDDSDMSGDFMLHILYLISKESTDLMPIYTARTFTNNRDIYNELYGINGMSYYDSISQVEKKVDEIDSSILDYDKNNICIDRFSLNKKNLVKAILNGFNKNRLKGYFFKHIFRVNPDTEFIFALARYQKSDVLKTEYLRLGLGLIGFNEYEVMENRIKHHCLKGDFKKPL